MPETFEPVQLSNDTGIKLNAAYFNRLETNIETIDDRAAALELGVLGPVTIAYAASLAIPANTGALFRITATGNLALTDITGGTDGQVITVAVKASGGARTVSFPGGSPSPVTVASGGRWVGRFIYDGADDTWALF